MVGFYTLLYKELLRFWRVVFQTVAAPILTALLYLLIFSHILQDRVTVYIDVGYTQFLVPGLAMMSVLQNAFANGSSSIIQSKVTGNIVFLLLAPISNFQVFLAYLLASVIRGVSVGFGVVLASIIFINISTFNFFWIIIFAVLGAGILACLGLLAGIWAEKFDQVAVFQNFIVMPMTFLSGVFYSIHSLPEFWQQVSRSNPFFYMIDGFRYGFFGKSDVSPMVSFLVVGIVFLSLSAVTFNVIKSGYKLRT
ncbi:MAG: metal-dependent hydrolase [Proteobacteria bacterium]|nr:metal-dependent hydrolase [Pseudomonadota bacterium]|tara:strand:+ start:95 stop:850 length:756 start_codon:yes stop_codon:yes gene_type:complete